MMVLLTGGILSACGQNEISIELNETHKEICLNDDSSHEVSVTAKVNGVDEGKVSVSSSYENIASASVAYNSITGANVITIKGVSEGNAEIVVTSNFDSSVRSVISVTVYSNITSMTQKDEDLQDGKSNLFALRGQWNNLNAAQLLDIKPINARKNITYKPKEGQEGITIEGDKLFVSPSYNQDFATITAVSDTGIEADITLAIIAQLDASTLTMEYSASESQHFEPLAGQKIQIVPNITSDLNYSAYIRFKFATMAGVDAEPKVFLSTVEDDGNISITRKSVSSEGGYTTYIYEVKAAQGKEALNATFDAYFEVGYNDYNHSVRSQDFKIACYEKVNKMNIYNDEGQDITFATQTIYTSYAFMYGAKYQIELLPTSVINATGKFKISVDYSSISNSILNGYRINENTLQFYYREKTGTITPVRMKNTGSGMTFISDDSALPYGSELYILADANLPSQLTDVKVSFTSCDNETIQVQNVHFNLYKSAANLEFGIKDDAHVMLSTTGQSTVTKTFSLEGQTSIEGLYVETRGEGFTASNPVETAHSDKNVTFQITFKVNANSIGVTRECSYFIKHRNGLSSEEFDVSLFLPLTEARVEYDNSSSAVTKSEHKGQLYVVDSEGRLIQANSNAVGLSNLLVQSGSSVPIEMFTNLVNGHYADRRVSFKYLDYETFKAEDDSYTIDIFNSLGADAIFQLANATKSTHLSMSENSLITTNNTGHSYVVISFRGLSESGSEVTYVRIIKVENYVAASQFTPSPSYSELYAYDSVGSDNFDETIQKVTIRLSDLPLSYNKILEHYSFELSSSANSQNTLKGKIVGNNSVEFDNGLLSLSHIILSDTSISFTVNALSTLGQQSVTSYLTVSYHNDELKDNIYRSCVVTVRIINADRVEKVTWENYQTQGLYFEVGEETPQILVFSTLPNNVKNYQLTYIPTDINGNSGVSNFVNIQKLGQDGEVSISSKVGMQGYIFVLPTDAINQDRISYYVLENGVQVQKSIESSRIYEFYTSSEFNKAYFINNNQQSIYFSNIICQVPVTIANGSSEELAYRIFTESEFKKIQTDKYYRVMRSLNLSNWTSFESLDGGIFGDNQDIAINLQGASLVKENRGLIKDLIFMGSVRGGGFIAENNSGNIINVSIDVQVVKDGFIASTLQSDDQFVGGIAGKNSGNIDNVKVLGLNIIQTSTVALADGQKRNLGGIVGLNNGGQIKNARFEIYNFAEDCNSIVGAEYVGGIIGQYNGGQVENVFIYDYTLSKDATQSNLRGAENSVGAIIANATASVVLKNSFAVVGNFDPVGDLNGNYLNFIGYISYYDASVEDENGYVSKFYNNSGNASDTATNSAFISSGKSFLSYVNGGKAHLLNFYQDEALGSVEDFKIAEKVVTQVGNYYKALQNGEKRGLLFYYGVPTYDYELMNEQERIELESLNTISFAQLFGKENAKLLVISSSDSRILQVSGRNLIIKSTGEVRITIYSRQNFETSETIDLDIVYALSNLEARRSGSNVSIIDKQELNVQKGKSISVLYNFEHAYIRLGTRGNNYKMLENDFDLKTDPFEIGAAEVSWQQTGKLNFTYTASFDSVKTEFTHFVSLNGYSDSVNQTLSKFFKREYSIVPFAGAIEIGGNVSEVAITPSIVGDITITLKTAQQDDKLTPSLSMMHAALDQPITAIEHQENTNLWIFDDKIRVEILEDINNLNQASVNNLYTYRFTVKVSVTENYRGLIDSDKHFKLTLASDAQVVSQDVSIKVTSQEFTNVTALNFRVENTLYGNVDGQNRTYYTINKNTSSILAPGSSSILKVDINPSFAYYDHLSIEYSGSDIAGALRIDFLKLSNEKFYVDTSSSIEDKENGLIVYPSNHQQLYFKLWASNLIEKDLNLTITIKFFAANSNEPITFIKYFLNISYMQEPQILVDGHSTAILAKGQTAEVRIVVPYDYDMEISSIITENIKYGITLSEKIKEEETAGSRVYVYKLSAKVDATLNDGGLGVFNIRATVRRVINGVEEVKHAYAIVNLVDFKIDNNNIKVENSDNDKFTTHLGIYRPLNFEYPLLPEEYSYDSSNQDSVAAYEKIQANIKYFKEHRYFADSDSQYYINYTRDEAGNPTNTPYKMYQLIKFHASNDQWISIYDGSNFITAGGYLEFNYDEVSNSISVKGLNQTPSATPLQFKLMTYVQAGNHYYEYEYLFNIEVQVYSDEDTPLLIDSEEKFYQMANGNPQNYILMKDLTLTEHTPFDTKNIASFDGNGYTINIQSFNLQPANTKNLDLALFKNVAASTTLKNVRVNLQNGGQMTIDLANKWTQVQVAGFAISNEGIITNCEVVAFGSNGNNRGINVKYIRGQGTSETIYITDTSTWTSQIAGFVISNSGSITNSRVGGSSITTIGETKYASDGSVIGFIKEEENLNNFYINGQGNIAGFAIDNSGTIAASFIANFGMYNESNSSSMSTSGFVKNNSGKVLTSYAEGVSNNQLVYERTGSSLKSKLGIIAGFVEINNGSISDTYSNILISNSSEDQQSYLASGFVYSNKGNIENSLSVSQVASLKYSQMNFSGVSSKGVLLANGEYINCYYYSQNNAADLDTTEENYNTGALRLKTLENEEQMYGFIFSSTSSSVDGIWTRGNSVSKVPRLIEPDNISFSNRYRVDIEEEPGRYVLPYSTMYVGGNAQPVMYGSASNPIIIRTAQEFVSVTGTSKSDYIKAYFTESSVSGTYRLVSDLDLSELLTEDNDTVSLPSTKKAFNGRLYGNGFAIKNLSIASSENDFSFGLFASIESIDMKKPVSSALVTNVNIELKKVSSAKTNLVGGLAGFVRDASIININMSNDKDAIVEGLNFVGGVSGFAFGNSKFKNVNVDAPNIIAHRLVTNGSEDNNVLSASKVANLRGFIINDIGNSVITNTSTNNLMSVITRIDGCSYAGGIIGFADIFGDGEATIVNYVYKEKIDISENDLIRLRVTTSANVQAQVVGGLFGFTGAHTDIKDIGIILNDTMASVLSRITSTKYYAGGLIGQSLSSVMQAFAQYNSDIQENIENNLSNYYSGNTTLDRGGVNIFRTDDLGKNLSQVAVGGLIGMANSGKLMVSYSKLNVISLDASFVGGLIGKVNTAQADLFYINDGIDEVETKYYINEVYATGDVRAKTRAQNSSDNFAAGGFIGRAEVGSLIVIKAANSVNFVSLYNYEYDVNYIAEQLKNEKNNEKNEEYSFNNINVYSILGSFDGGRGTDVITFMQAREKIQDENVSTEARPNITVGSVKVYNTSILNLANEVKIEAFEGADTLAEKDVNGSYVNNEGKLADTFGIPSISNYQSIEIGYHDTYGVFLGTHLWERANWNHSEGNLYPTIRFSLTVPEFIYLDAYETGENSIANFFDAIESKPDIEVRVRGRLAENSDEVGHIDLASYMAKYGRGAIDGFKGTLKGEYGENKVSSTNKAAYIVNGWGDERPAIVLDQPLFNNTTDGLLISDVTFKYINRNNVGSGNHVTLYSSTDGDIQTSFSGALINGNMQGGTLNAVTMEFYTNKESGASNTINLKGTDVGLVASRINDSDIVGLNIYIKDILNTETFLNTSAQANVGLVAGVVVAGDENRDHNFEGINIISAVSNDSNLSPLITATNAKNIGGYFGSVILNTNIESEENKTDIKNINIGFGQIAINKYDVDNPSQWRTGNIVETSNRYNISSNAENVGGYIGNASYVRRITLETDPDIENFVLANTQFIIGANVTNLNVGGFIGSYSSGDELSLKPNTINALNIKSRVIIQTGSTDNNEEKPTNNVVNLGGLVGKSTSPVKIENICTQFGADSASSQESPINGNDYLNDYRNKLNLDNGYDFKAIFVKGNANVGGIIGHAENTFTYKNSVEAAFNEQSDAVKNFVIALKALNELNMGGLIGKADNETNISASAEAKLTSRAVLYGQGKTANIGGLIGTQDCITKTQNDSTFGGLKINDNNSLGESTSIEFLGEIYTSSNANIGGIVANTTLSNKTSAQAASGQIAINNTSFGGAIKVFKATSKNFNIGGTIGNMGGTGDANIYSISMQNNSNYGDVFMLTSYGNLTYGGLVANGAKVTAGGISNNYILTTINNQFLNSGDTINAVFGSIKFDGGTCSNNYYNHAVCLSSDNQAIDAGYEIPYGTSNTGGYNTGHDGFTGANNNKTGLAEKIASNVKFTGENNKKGEKLNPIKLEKTIDDSNEGLDKAIFNGMTYYYYDGSSIKFDAQFASKLDNIAIIGETYQMSIELNKDTNFIGEMSGCSFISGFVANLANKFEVDTSNEKEEKKIPSYGGLVGQMTSGTIYAVGVTGSMDIGGTAQLTLGGLVGQMTSGLIKESLTDVYMLYRAAENGQTAAVVGNAKGGIITHSYAVGTVECYIDSCIDGFSIGGVTVRNSYSTVNLVWHDYTSSTTADESTDKITMFRDVKAETQSSIYYDKHVNGGSVKGNGIAKTTVQILERDEKEGIFTDGNGWAQNLRYNYSYPTRKYNYLQLSSLFERGNNAATNEESARGIKSFEYSRLSHFETSNLQSNNNSTETKYVQDYFFAIPNAGIWANHSFSEYPNAILRNDLYMDYLVEVNTKESLKNNCEQKRPTKQISLDGQGHRIYNYIGQTTKNNIGPKYYGALFNSLAKGSEVINLDILNATVKDSGVLANQATNSFFSNITLSGNFTTNGDCAGGLLGKVIDDANSGENSHTSLCSIMSNLNVKGTSTSYGGIVGQVNGIDSSRAIIIKYCVNNGPIVITGKSLKVGGIAGQTSNAKILYSYNTSSVLANFTAATNSNSTNYGGGIVGCSEENTYIDHCLNSGLVYVGNKQETQIQYAGGIVGYMKGAKNDNNRVQYCINEGSVQALAENGDFEVRGIEDESSASSGALYNKITFGIYQTSSINVYANSIGAQNGSAIECEDGDNHNSSEDGDNHNYNYNSSTDIIANGAGFVKDKPIWKAVYNAPSIYGDLKSYGNGFQRHIYIPKKSQYSDINEDLAGRIFEMSRDEYNMPTAFYVKKDFDFTYVHNFFDSIDGLDQGNDEKDEIKRKITGNAGASAKSITYTTYVAEQFVNNDGDVYQKALGKNTIPTGDNFSNIRAEILAPTPWKKDRDVIIKGNKYLTSDFSGDKIASVINNATIYSFELNGLELPYGKAENYTLTLDGVADDGSVQFFITSIKVTDNKVSLNVTAYSLDVENSEKKVITESSIIKVEFNKEITEIVDLSDLAYSYYETDDEYPQGTILFEDKNDLFNFLKQSNVAQKYGYIPRIIWTKNEQNESVFSVKYYGTQILEASLNGKTIYLVYDSVNNMVEYIPNVVILQENENLETYFDVVKDEDENIKSLTLKTNANANTEALRPSDFADKNLTVKYNIVGRDDQEINIKYSNSSATNDTFTNPNTGEIEISAPNNNEYNESENFGNIIIGDNGSAVTDSITLNTVNRSDVNSVSKTAKTDFSGLVEPIETADGEGGEAPEIPSVLKIKLGNIEILSDSNLVATSVTLGGKEFVCSYDIDTKLLTLTYTGELAADAYADIQSELSTNLTLENCTWAYTSTSQEKDLYSFSYNISITGDKAMTFVNNMYDGSAWSGLNDIEIDGVNLIASAAGGVLTFTAEGITLDMINQIKAELDSIALTYDSLTYSWTSPTNVDNWIAGYVNFDGNVWSKDSNGALTEGLNRAENKFSLTMTNQNESQAKANISVDYAYQLVDLDDFSKDLTFKVYETKTLSSNGIIDANIKYYYEDFSFESSKYQGVDIYKYQEKASTDTAKTYTVTYSEALKAVLEETFGGVKLYIGNISASYTAKTTYTKTIIEAEISAKQDYYVEVETNFGDSTKTTFYAEETAKRFSYEISNQTETKTLSATAYPFFDYNFNGKDYIDNISSFNINISLIVDSKTTLMKKNEDGTYEILEETILKDDVYVFNKSYADIIKETDPSVLEKDYTFVKEETLKEDYVKDGKVIAKAGDTIKQLTTYTSYMKIFKFQKIKDSAPDKDRYRFYYNLCGEFRSSATVTEMKGDEIVDTMTIYSTISFDEILYNMPKNDTVNMPASGSQSPNGIDGDIDYTIYDEKGHELNNQPESLEWMYKPNGNNKLTLQGVQQGSMTKKIAAFNKSDDEKYPVILFRNINLGKIVSFGFDTQIYGNGYTLSYYSNQFVLPSLVESGKGYQGLFTNIEKTGMILDTNFASQVNNNVANYASTVAYKNEGTIKNVNVFGNIRIRQNSNAAGLVNENSGTIENISMFTSIRSTNASTNLSAFINTNIKNVIGEVNLGGVIVAANGRRGTSKGNTTATYTWSGGGGGKAPNLNKFPFDDEMQNIEFGQLNPSSPPNAQLGYGMDGDAGGAGVDGGNIKLLGDSNIEGLDFNVQGGIFVPGRGGNGGAGGVGANGRIENYNSAYKTANVNGGNGGVGGKEGAKGWVYTYGTTKSDSEEVTSISHAYSESIAGSAGSGGMHGWILPTEVRGSEKNRARGYILFGININKFIEFSNLNSGQPGNIDKIDNKNVIYDLCQTTHSGKAIKGWNLRYYTRNGRGYIFKIHSGWRSWGYDCANAEDFPIDKFQVKQALISLMFPNCSIKDERGDAGQAQQEINNDYRPNDEDSDGDSRKVAAFVYWQDLNNRTYDKTEMFSDKCSECK